MLSQGVLLMALISFLPRNMLKTKKRVRTAACGTFAESE